MKVKLLVNLKIATGRILSAGTIFSDEKEPIPEFILKRISRRQVQVIDPKPFVPKLEEAEEIKGEIPESIAKVIKSKKILSKKEPKESE